jgi:predicted Zn-ribbon and HTH transcriptional regulator
MNFDDLPTMKFMRKMQPHAWRIYEKEFPGCEPLYLRPDNFDGSKDHPDVHILDQQFAIDSMLRFPDGSFFTLQEKYRKNTELKFGDFTQTHMKAYGTPYEAKGEWFHLAAQLYFYGWANEDETDFEDYLLLDVVRYKLLVLEAGGLDRIGEWRQNPGGGASFFGICVEELRPAIIRYKIGPKHQKDIDLQMECRRANKESEKRWREKEERVLEPRHCRNCGLHVYIDYVDASGAPVCPHCRRFNAC